eukprot:COSAG06_NODE_37_length_30537_cov_73.315658_4_plen_53_part_00
MLQTSAVLQQDTPRATGAVQLYAQGRFAIGVRTLTQKRLLNTQEIEMQGVIE